jgi:hypothetical protein
MATVSKAKVTASKATLVSKVGDNSVVLTPAIQRQVKILRDSRNLAKQAKELSEPARLTILDFIGEVTSNLVGTDAKGKHLVKVSVIQSSEKIDWEAIATEFAKIDPELFEALVKQHTSPKGAGKSILKVDVI